MYKKICLFLLFLVFLSIFRIARAGVIINEVQISPTAGRFVELYNQDNAEVDLTDWYLQRKTASGGSFSSLVTKTYFENKKIGPKEFFVISKSSLSNSNLVVDSLTLTESNAIQLKNQNSDVVDKIAWGDSNECDSNSPDNPTEGNSLQLVNNSWLISSPTIGFANKGSDIDNDSNISQQSTVKDKIPLTKTRTIEPSMKLDILVNNPAYAKQAILFQSNILGYLNEKVVLGKLYWNFGDGTSFEQVNNFEKFYKTYFYPGEYSLSLEYYSNVSKYVPDIVESMTIKVIPIVVSISRVGNPDDFFIEIANNSNFDIDISKWTLSSMNKNFIFPKNSIILAKKEMRISDKITGFVFGDKYDLKLKMPNGEIVHDYISSNVVPKSINQNTFKKSLNNIPENIENQKETENIENNNLRSNAIDISENLIGNDINFAFIFGLVILLVVAGSFVYFLRQKRNIKKIGDDFEILDE